MKRKTSPALLAAMLVCLTAVLLAGTYGPLKPFVQSVKPQAASIAVLESGKQEDQLMRWIKSEATKRNKPPIDAVIDRVWKAIPGYNGRVVDVEATYQKAKLLGLTVKNTDQFPWVYRELKPKVSLMDLPKQPIYRGNPSKPMVAFMINVAWGDEYLLPMLDILKEARVKATFFFDGTWLSKHMDTARSIVAQGHEVSNHAYTHPNMSQLGATRQREEIGKTEALLKKLGVTNVWFAPPSGYYNENTVKVANEYGLRTVLWTLDTIDWQKPQPWTVIDKVSRHVSPGTLILMHPTATSQGALKGMIKVIKSKGYTLGTVSETLSSERVDDRL
ncbi:polysaccharide deacetylase family protein [Cohnella silvisoli]|uniref:Polysaccharide deacetylase family protein n=1 Tax=Cohnella silvisoli TaxID=2873699 RepID=A0ABV1KVE2_9BACL|nr:polysaccharide deacetylase family protein [Cohnella silvisoli]MCD9023413.1 polysaccharide deacetylase family protein [Cohnella silvisoli]